MESPTKNTLYKDYKTYKKLILEDIHGKRRK